MKPGFVPALGTPFDANGKFLAESYKKQINDQIKAGCRAILSMGSMGTQAMITYEEYPKVAAAAVEAAAGRVPVYVGAMDCSIAKVKERMAKMEHLDIDAFVFTTPFYGKISNDQILNYYKGIAAATKHNIMLYDLAVTTQNKITYEMVLEMIRDIPNLIGIKSADTAMFRKLKLNPDVPDDFIMVYSGLDTFDVVYQWGINTQLDGMLSCTPTNTRLLYEAMEKGDFEKAAVYMDNILGLRDMFIANGLWPCFTAAMNLLGYEGVYGPDYVSPGHEGVPAIVEEWMRRIGEI